MSIVPTAKLGRNGPEVSRIGFGAMGLSVAYGPGGTDEDRMKVLSRAVELGSTMIDSANAYGDNEELIGKWLAKNPGIREKIFLATKFGLYNEADGSWRGRGDAAYVKQEVEASLKKLGVETIDLLYVHRIDKTVPIEETIGAMAEYVRVGKVRYLGLSECSSDTLRRAHAVHPINALQIEYSPFALDIEQEQIGLLKTCRELGVAIVAYSPLSRGILTGTLKSRADFGPADFRAYAPRFSEENFNKNLVLVEKVTELSKKRGVTPAQMVLAWILAQGDDFFPIPGTKRTNILEENAGAARVDLTQEEVELIRRYANECEVAGSRYPAAFEGDLFGDSAPKR